jgi:hypothetical protein
MKRPPKTNKQVRVPRKRVPEQAGSHTMTVKETRERLIDQVKLATCEATGTRSYEVAARIIYQVGNAHVWPKAKNEIDSMIAANATMSEMAPQNVTEAMLASQMIATHDAATMFLWRATPDGQSTEAIDANVLRATRLMRLFLEQLDAMAKLKGKASQQKVTVEHVHVHKGGQAIVGAVTPPALPPGGGGKV